MLEKTHQCSASTLQNERQNFNCSVLGRIYWASVYKLPDTKRVFYTCSFTQIYSLRENWYHLKIMINFRVLLFFNLCNANFCLNAVHLRALINNSLIKNNKLTNVKIMFLHKIRHNFDMFRSVLIIFRELLTSVYCLKLMYWWSVSPWRWSR